MVNSGCAKHASLGGGLVPPPKKICESKCPEIDSGGIWQPCINHSCDSTCTCKLPVKTQLRNRISDTNLAKLMRIVIEGPELSFVDFNEIVVIFNCRILL